MADNLSLLFTIIGIINNCHVQENSMKMSEIIFSCFGEAVTTFNTWFIDSNAQPLRTHNRGVQEFSSFPYSYVHHCLPDC